MTGRMISSPAESAAWTIGGEPIWVAAVAHSGKVLVARDGLLELTQKAPEIVDAYAPAIKQTRRIYGEDREIELPVMGRYFFVRLLLAGEWARARYVRGVQALLPTHSLRPLRIPDRLIDQVKADVESGRFSPAALVRMLRRFLAGEEVDVIEGPLLEVDERAHGTVLWQRGDRVKLALSCAGSEREVILPADQLAPSGSSGRRTQPRPCRKRARTRAVYPARAAI